jgi:hypothetical protein
LCGKTDFEPKWDSWPPSFFLAKRPQSHSITHHEL